MRANFLVKLTLGIQLDAEELKKALEDVCFEVHNPYSCDDRCPVFYLNNKEVPLGEDWQCSCKNNGDKMSAFIKENTDISEGAPKKKKKKVVVASKEQIERFDSFFRRTIQMYNKEYGDEKATLKVFSCKNPLSPMNIGKIIEDLGINEVDRYKKVFFKVIFAIENWKNGSMTDANATIRNWFKKELGIDSLDDLVLPYKTIVVETPDELVKEAEELKVKRNRKREEDGD